MVRPSRRGRLRPLSDEYEAGTVDGTEIDWDTGGYVPPPFALDVLDEGVSLTASPVSIDFVGAGVTATETGDAVTVTIPGGSSDAELNIEGGQSVIHAHGATGATETIDPTLGNVHTLTLDADCTLTLSGPVGAGAATLELWVTQDGTGGRDITWPGSVTEEGTHDTTAGTTQRVILETIDGGTAWIATWIGTAGEPTADAHIADTSDAHDASAISVLDTGGNFTGTDVEAALAELAAATPTGHYEILMASGSADPLLTSDGLDYLYVWVT